MSDRETCINCDCSGWLHNDGNDNIIGQGWSDTFRDTGCKFGCEIPIQGHAASMQRLFKTVQHVN